jgi:predicted O-methyltransferase YrrM
MSITNRYIGRRNLRAAAEKVLRPTAGALGYELVRNSFYNPLPASEDLSPGLWELPSPMLGVAFDVGSQFRFLEDQLSGDVERFGQRLKSEATSFRLDNGMYESVDAETLYAMVRYANPRLVIELGSGSSSHVIAMALEDGDPGSRYRVFDPYPWTASGLGARSGVEVLARRATDVPLAEFEALGPNDILFIDTTHTVKTGGDVSHLFLNVLPRLAAGVLVHIHDIFLPWEYPRHWVVDQRRAWAEQYLLQAFLEFNSDFEVVLGAYAMARADPQRLTRTVPSFDSRTAPGSFWIQRTG